jgi:hypothetical protein
VDDTGDPTCLSGGGKQGGDRVFVGDITGHGTDIGESREVADGGGEGPRVTVGENQGGRSVSTVEEQSRDCGPHTSGSAGDYSNITHDR